GDLVPYIGCRSIRAATEIKFNIDNAALGTASRSHDIDPLDTRKLVFKRFGDLTLDDVRRGSLVIGDHRYYGLVNSRIFTHTEPIIRDQPYQYDEQGKYSGKYGSPDTKL